MINFHYTYILDRLLNTHHLCLSLHNLLLALFIESPIDSPPFQITLELLIIGIIALHHNIIVYVTQVSVMCIPLLRDANLHHLVLGLFQIHVKSKSEIKDY